MSNLDDPMLIRWDCEHSAEDEEEELRRWVLRVRQGDLAAARELVQKYESEIRMEVRMRMRDRRLWQILDSTDICQSVFASFFVRVSLGDFEFHESHDLLRLLVQMTRHKVANQVRRFQASRRDIRRTQSLTWLGEESLVCNRHESPSEPLEFDELLERFRSRMTARERQIADCRSVGKTWTQISLELAESPNVL